MLTTNCTATDAPQSLSFTTGALSLVLSLFTITGNSLVLLAVFINPYKDLSNPFSYFIVNLAVADLIVGCITEPYFVYHHILEGLDDEAHIVGVKIVHVLFFVSSIASLLNFSLLAYERHLAIVSALRYRLLFSVRRLLILVVFVWLLSICLTLIYFLTTFVHYSFAFVNIAVVWSMLTFLYTYIKILRKLKEKVHEVPGQVRTGNIHNDGLRQQRNNTQLTKTYATMLIVFLICYIPACILSYLMNFCTTCSCEEIHYFRDWHLLSVLLNSALNPYVYALRFSKFRRAILKIICNGSSQRRGAQDSLSPEETSPSNVAMESLKI